MWIGVVALLRIRNANGPKQLDRLASRLPLARSLVTTNCLRNLIAGGIDRIEEGHRILKNHADLAASQILHLLVRKGQNVSPLKENAAAGVAAGRRWHQPHDRARSHALA